MSIAHLGLRKLAQQIDFCEKMKGLTNSRFLLVSVMEGTIFSGSDKFKATIYAGSLVRYIEA